VIIALLVLYPLSIGPAIRISRDDTLFYGYPVRRIAMIYYPLIKASEVPLVGRPLVAYINFWNAHKAEYIDRGVYLNGVGVSTRK
jgi:hypothetical protein